jgi:hypothetical protein
MPLKYNKFVYFQSLSADQRRWVWSAYWRLWPTLLRIKFSQADWLKKQIEFSSVQDSIPKTNSVKALDMYESVRLAARLHFMSAECLPRSLVLAAMLNSHGCSAIVRIGVAKANHGIASHAWVEIDGNMVGEVESVSSDFTPLG